jgi:hypothetical protein
LYTFHFNNVFHCNVGLFLPAGRRRSKKEEKKKIKEIEIVDKVKVKCPRASHEGICVRGQWI